MLCVQHNPEPHNWQELSCTVQELSYSIFSTNIRLLDLLSASHREINTQAHREINTHHSSLSLYTHLHNTV